MYYVLSVGTNMGDRLENIKGCITALGHLPNTKVLSVSSIYETEPVGYKEQNSFYNCCLLVSSGFNAHEMLGACLGIEASFGRVREVVRGPRVLDIDLIFAQNQKISTQNLTVPHPRFSERRFVLEPLLDIFTDGSAFGIDFKQYIPEIEGQKIKKVAAIQVD